MSDLSFIINNHLLSANMIGLIILFSVIFIILIIIAIIVIREIRSGNLEK